MSWNYRIMKETSEIGDTFHLREVFYDDDGKPREYTAPFMMGDSVEDLIATLELALNDLRKDRAVLTLADFPVGE